MVLRNWDVHRNWELSYVRIKQNRVEDFGGVGFVRYFGPRVIEAKIMITSFRDGIRAIRYMLVLSFI